MKIDIVEIRRYLNSKLIRCGHEFAPVHYEERKKLIHEILCWLDTLEMEIAKEVERLRKENQDLKEKMIKIQELRKEGKKDE